MPCRKIHLQSSSLASLKKQLVLKACQQVNCNFCRMPPKKQYDVKAVVIMPMAAVGLRGLLAGLTFSMQ
jgi:hypothetical protein